MRGIVVKIARNLIFDKFIMQNGKEYVVFSSPFKGQLGNRE